MSFCEWCLKNHREGTKIQKKHQKILRKICEGQIPCNLGKCTPYLCRHLIEIYRAGLRKLDTNCNRLLSEINQIEHNLEVLKEKVEK